MDEEIDMRDECRDDENPLVAENHILEAVYLAPGDTHHRKKYSAESHRRLDYPSVERELRTRQEGAEYRADKSSDNMKRTPEHEQTEYVRSQVPDVSVG